MTRITLYHHLLVFVLATFFLGPGLPSANYQATTLLPDLAGSTQSLGNGHSRDIRGVSVSDVLALPVVQQPANHPYYVSNRDGEITQFSIASRYGNIGLLAHNSLSGKFFSRLAPGQEVRVVYGDGRVEYFVVSQILRYQALQPDSVSSSFRNLDQDEVLSAGGMFNRAYVGKYHLVFQTCIEAEGNPSWGRLFVVALPKK
jgi:hypothetical protein